MKKLGYRETIRVVVPFAALVVISGAARAAESYDLTNCGSSTTTVVSNGKASPAEASTCP